MQQSTSSIEKQIPVGPLDVLQPNLTGSGEGTTDFPAVIAYYTTQLHTLRSEVTELRAEHDRLLEQRQQIAELLNSPSPDKLMHDLRNMLNELQLLKMLDEMQR